MSLKGGYLGSVLKIPPSPIPPPRGGDRFSFSLKWNLVSNVQTFERFHLRVFEYICYIFLDTLVDPIYNLFVPIPPNLGVANKMTQLDLSLKILIVGKKDFVFFMLRKLHSASKLPQCEKYKIFFGDY